MSRTRRSGRRLSATPIAEHADRDRTAAADDDPQHAAAQIDDRADVAASRIVSPSGVRAASARSGPCTPGACADIEIAVAAERPGQVHIADNRSPLAEISRKKLSPCVLRDLGLHLRGQRIGRRLR